MTYLTLTEYAKKHNISRQTARWRMLNWKLRRKRIGSIWVVQDKGQP